MGQQQEFQQLAEEMSRHVEISRSYSVPVMSIPTRLVPPEPDIGTGIDLITRATGLIGAQRQHIDAVEIRAAEAEERLDAAVQRIAATELKLRSALEELQRERDRSAELLSQTQGMLDEASGRLTASETRSEGLHSALATLLDVLDQRLGPEVSLRG